MSLHELYRYDIQLFQDYTSADTRQIAASGIVVDVYKEGATASADADLADGAGGTITVYDPGCIVAGDTVQVETTSTVTRTVASITATTVVLNAGAGAFSIDAEQRLLPVTSRPLLYTDDQGGTATATASQVTTDANGTATFYSRHRTVDWILDDGTTAVLQADQTGSGGRESYSPQDFGAKGDNSANDYNAFAYLETFLEAKGAGVFEIPPGTYLLGSTLTISGSNIHFRGAGRGVTTLKINHAGTGITVTGTDVVLEGFTIQQVSGSGVQIALAGSTRATVRDVHFKDGGTGITCVSDTDSRIDKVWFTSTTAAWTSFIYLAVSTRPHISSLVARAGGNVTYGIDVNYDTVSPRLDRIDIAPATVTASGGIALECRKSGGTNPPRDVTVSTSRLCGGTSTGSAPAVEISTSTGAVGVELAEFIGVHCVDSEYGYKINNGTAVKIIGGSTVGIQKHGIDINGGSYLQIVEHLSSNVNDAAGSYNHVDIAAGVDDVYINGLVVGRMVRGTGAGADAVYGVAIAAGVSDRVQIMGLRGVVADLVTGWISNGSTSREIDISHNIEYGNSRSYTHTAVPGAEGGGGYAGTVTQTAADATPSVLNVSTIFFDLGAALTLTDLDDGRDGQVVSLINIDAVNFPAITDGGNFLLAGNWAPGSLGDSITLVYNSTLAQWIELARADA